jgi:hypothetical protein
MTTERLETAGPHVANVNIPDSLGMYLKFLKSHPPLDEIFFYLQSTFLLDCGFDAISLYAIDFNSKLTCIESAGVDVLAEQGVSSLVDVKKIIPPMLPTQADPITECILSHDE